MSAVRSAAGRTFASLRTCRNLRWYLSGAVLSQVGTWMQVVALPWLVLHLTRSGSALGLAYAVQFLPILTLGFFAGVIADRSDKRKLMLATAGLQGLLAVVLGVVTLTGTATLGLVIALTFANGLVTAFDQPARRSFVPEMVPPESISNAVSLNNAILTSARIVGPSIAGLCIATIGVGWCFVANGVSFLAVVVSLLAIRTSELHRSPVLERARGQIRQGLTYTWNHRVIRMTIASIFVVGTLAFNYQVVLPLLAKRVFATGAGGYGLMFAATGIGSVAGALFSAHRSRASAVAVTWSSLALGASMALVGFAPSIAVAYPALVVMGAAGMVFLSMATSVLQERAQPEFRGRVNSVFAVAFVGSTAFGSPLVGWIAQTSGARAAILVGAAAAGISGACGMLVVRRWAGARIPTPAGESLGASAP